MRLANKYLKLSTYIFILLVMFGCANFSIGKDMSEEKTQFTIPENCDFSTVGEVFLNNECSPIIFGRKHKGIVINMPKEHYFSVGNTMPFGGFTYLPVCGSYRVANGELPGRRIEDALLLVAVDTKTKEVYSGRFKLPGVELPMPEAFRQQGNHKTYPPGTYVGGGNFNYNLAEVVNLPERPAEYIVYVTAGPYKSNVRTVKIIQKKE